jgi:hypothetical protein
MVYVLFYKELKNNIHTYKEIHILIRNELNKISNIAEFAKQHEMNYIVLLNITSKKSTRAYPIAIAKLYMIFFKKKIKYEKLFVEEDASDSI